MAAPTFTSLIPATSPVEADPLVAGLEWRHPPTVERPYTIANFVCSVDGRAAFNGRSGAFSDEGDRALFHALRERADAVLAGTTTLRMERYGRVIPDPERRARRLAAGRPAEPLAVTISRSGVVPLEAPLFGEPEARVLIFAAHAPDLSGVAASVAVEPLRGDGPATLRAAMATLHRDHGIDTLLCEGGPTVFGALVRAGLIDELFLTLSPRLTGGDSGPAITAGRPLSELQPLAIRGLLSRGDSLYLRYAVTN
jgi:riboflavin biosynthesis pyrimidine reductase